MKEKTVRGPRVERTRNDSTFTEAQYWGWIRSNLRRMSMRWKPLYGALRDARHEVAAQDKAKWGNRIRWLYECAQCGKLYPRKEIEIDHIIACGSCKSQEDVGVFVSRLLCERAGLRVVCVQCHQAITAEART